METPNLDEKLKDLDKRCEDFSKRGFQNDYPIYIAMCEIIMICQAIKKDLNSYKYGS